MYRLLRFLFTGRWELPPLCDHVWKILNTRGYRYTKEGAVHVRHTLQCTRCGNIKYTDSD